VREDGISGDNINANLNQCATLCCCLAWYGLIYGFHILGKIANFNIYFALHMQCTKHGHVVYNAKIRTDCTNKVMVVSVRL
jgi:hypothetical protein